MDLVYAVTGPKHDQLRYSLRSMSANYEHRTVFLIGQPPLGVFTGLGAVTIKKGNDRWRNTSDALMAACCMENVSDPFLYMNDDFFCLSERAHTDWDRGPLTDTLIPHRRNSDYRKGGIAAIKVLKNHGITDPLSYELHLPMLIDKALMIEVLEELRYGKYSESFKRTVYGNRLGRTTKSRADVKVRALPLPADDWVSTVRGSFEGPLGDQIRARFPDPCYYEEES